MILSLDRMEDLIARAVPPSVASLALRVALAVPFFRSGLTKWDGFLQLSDTTHLLFNEEFKLHILGKVYDYPYPALAAWASGLAEIILPVLLVLGLGTRFAALGLLIMTAIIQLTVPEGWANFHLLWAATALAILLIGPSRIALDSILRKRTA
jgi:putative oxidoreductase